MAVVSTKFSTVAECPAEERGIVFSVEGSQRQVNTGHCLEIDF